MVIVFPLSPSGWSVSLSYLVPSSVRIKELGKDELQPQANHIPVPGLSMGRAGTLVCQGEQLSPPKHVCNYSMGHPICQETGLN